MLSDCYQRNNYKRYIKTIEEIIGSNTYKLLADKLLETINPILCLIVGKGRGDRVGSNCKFWEKTPQVPLILIGERVTCG